MKDEFLKTIKEYLDIVREVFTAMSIYYFSIFLLATTLLNEKELSEALVHISKKPQAFLNNLSNTFIIFMIIYCIFKVYRAISDKINIEDYEVIKANPSCMAKRVDSFNEVVEYSKTKYPITKAHSTDSGFDLKSVEEFSLEPGEIRLVSTGIKLALPKNYEAQVRPKSGLSSKGFMVYLGTVDNEYRGEVKVIAQNNSIKKIDIKDGQKIAQIVFNKLDNIELLELSDIQEDTERGEGGFGSTGKF